MAKPCGWRILIETCVVAKKSPGGILLPEETKSRNQYRAGVAKVLKLGPLAFKSRKENLGDNPWCNEGDMIYVSPDIGYILWKSQDEEGNSITYKYIDDEDVLGIVESGDKNHLKTIDVSKL